MRELISEVMYCAKCEKHGRPVRGNYYVYIQDGVSEIAQIKDIHIGSEKGLVPHLITNIGFISGGVVITTYCGMDGCGIYIHKYKDGRLVTYDDKGRQVFKEEDSDFLYVYNEDGLKEYLGDDDYVSNRFNFKTRGKKLTLSLIDWNALRKTKFRFL